MADSSFDVVSKVDRQEVDNALNQAGKELGTRFDFKNVGASVAWSGDATVMVKASTEERCKAALDVFRERLVKRGVSLKALQHGEPQLSGKEYRLSVTINQGIADDKAKSIVKKIKTEAPRGVNCQVQGDQLRVSAKKKDDLQSVIALLKESDFGIPLQCVNFR